MSFTGQSSIQSTAIRASFHAAICLTHRALKRGAGIAVVGLGLSGAVQAQTLVETAGTLARPHLSLNGTPGLIDMPTAFALADGDFAVTYGTFGDFDRGTLAFQITPRLTGVFRYSQIAGFNGDGTDRFDRSFDVAYQLLTEGDTRPALTIGMRDFGGTGVNEGEYLVASKSFGAPRSQGERRALELTAGLGWGRLAGVGGFKNPLGLLSTDFETRPRNVSSVQNGTGQIEFDRVFRGDAALFGGVLWRPSEKLSLMAEYSSDAYAEEATRIGFERKSPYNFGAAYDLSPSTTLSGYYLYGTEIGAQISFTVNPKVPGASSGVEPAPISVAVRTPRVGAPARWPTGWVKDDAQHTAAKQSTAALLAAEGLFLETLDLSASEARVSLRNKRFGQSAQAIGRTARILTNALPASVETFRITLLTSAGLPTTETVINRSDLEELEFAPDNSWKSYARADINDAASQRPAAKSLTQSKLSFSLGGYTSQTFFDPNQPFSFDAGLRAEARYEPRPGWVLGASVRQPFLSNRDNINRASNSVLPFVRSEQDDFNRGNTPKLDRLTLSHYFRPGDDFYGRVTAGYLETAYAGLSTELLWKPIDSRLALGVEVNAVHQRQPGDVFGLGSGVFDNDAVTGHGSMYYALNNGFHTQLDVGRYLAGDWGGTFTLTREFRNGWEVGAFFSLTDVGFEDFGEGAFDKGIFFTIPTSWVIGRPSRNARTSTIRPVLRDGGARVNVSGRLYETVRPDSEPLLSDGWGRFWR